MLHRRIFLLVEVKSELFDAEEDLNDGVHVAVVRWVVEPNNSLLTRLLIKNVGCDS